MCEDKLKNSLIEEFLMYNETILGLSTHTVNAYLLDLTEFFRFLVAHKDGKINTLADNIQNVSVEELSEITLPDFYSYLNYTLKYRKNGDATRGRKTSSIKSFFKYLTNKRKLLPIDPSLELEIPKISKRKINYLQVDECWDLIKNIKGHHAIRDRAIIVFFLNCGMRLSELTGIKIRDIKGDALRIIGKGDKERIVYLNDACHKALMDYLAVRKSDSPYLFISGRGNPISNRSVQTLIKKHLNAANLDTDKISVNKLRHTAATLLFQNGVDTRTIQELLGHESLVTTQIYTHTNSQQLKDASNSLNIGEFDK